MLEYWFEQREILKHSNNIINKKAIQIIKGQEEIIYSIFPSFE